MDEKQLKKLLDEVAAGRLSSDEALGALSGFSCLKLAEVTLDTGREHRTGAPEVIYAEGKEAAVLIKLAQMARKEKRRLLMTRLDPSNYAEIERQNMSADEYHPRCRIAIWWGAKKPRLLPGKVLVITAGTTDLGVAEEAYHTARFLGLDVELIGDVGVAGLHRLLEHHEKLKSVACIIAVAGMEGALPSVVAGLVEAPVVAVPTSVGYGAAFGGITALLAMLNSCSGGVGVVNIDNGFGGALLAFKIVRATGRIP